MLFFLLQMFNIIAHDQEKTNYTADTASGTDLLLLFPPSCSRTLYILRADQCKILPTQTICRKNWKKRDREKKRKNHKNIPQKS